MVRRRGKKPKQGLRPAGAAAAAVAANDPTKNQPQQRPYNQQIMTFARSWTERLVSPDPHVREDGCDDIIAIAVEKNLLPALLDSEVPATLVSMILSDTAQHVRVAATAALQNICSAGGDVAIDRVSALSKKPASAGAAAAAADGGAPAVPLPQALLNALGVSFEEAKKAAQVAQQQKQNEPEQHQEQLQAQEDEDDEGNNNNNNNNNNRNNQRGGNDVIIDASPLRFLGELLSLCSVLCESSDAFAAAFSHSKDLLRALVELIVDGTQTDLGYSAAELLFILSDYDDENNNSGLTPVAQFLASDISDQQRQTIDGIITLQPSTKDVVTRSPTTLCTAVFLAGAFVSSFPQHAQRVVALLTHAMRVSVYGVVAQVMPILAVEFSQEVGTSREARLQDGPFRALRAINTAVTVAQEILTIASEEAAAAQQGAQQQQQQQQQQKKRRKTEDDDDDHSHDDSAIRGTSTYARCSEAGMVDASLTLCGEVVVGPQDVMLRELLCAPTTSGHILSLQASFQSAVTSILTFNSSLLMVELTAAGNEARRQVIWSSSMSGIEFRLQGLALLASSAATGQRQQQQQEDSTAPRWWDGTDEQLYLQIESLVSIAWTILRTSGGTIAPQPEQVQMLRKLFWEHESITPDTRVAITGSIGATAVAAAANNHVEALTACTEFLVQALTAAARQGQQQQQNIDEVVHVAAEAANVLMDAFSDERFDDSVYRPLGVHAALVNFRPSIGKRRSARNRHLNGVMTNLAAFIEYKVQQKAA